MRGPGFQSYLSPSTPDWDTSSNDYIGDERAWEPHNQDNLQCLLSRNQNIRKNKPKKKKHDILCLSFNPLLAARIAFRECDTFFFGTASKNGGKRSTRDWREGIDQFKADLAAVKEVTTTLVSKNGRREYVRIESENIPRVWADRTAAAAAAILESESVKRKKRLLYLYSARARDQTLGGTPSTSSYISISLHVPSHPSSLPSTQTINRNHWTRCPPKSSPRPHQDLRVHPLHPLYHPANLRISSGHRSPHTAQTEHGPNRKRWYQCRGDKIERGPDWGIVGNRFRRTRVGSKDGRMESVRNLFIFVFQALLTNSFLSLQLGRSCGCTRARPMGVHWKINMRQASLWRNLSNRSSCRLSLPLRGPKAIWGRKGWARSLDVGIFSCTKKEYWLHDKNFAGSRIWTYAVKHQVINLTIQITRLNDSAIPAS